jgi:5-deoxy-glucuronate isomerase
MLIRQPGEFQPGRYAPITSLAGPHPEMLMDFGILRLAAGQAEAGEEPKERAYLLLGGTVEIDLAGGHARMARASLFDRGPWCLHLPAGSQVTLRAVGGPAEIAVHKTTNARAFEPRLYTPEECRDEERGKGTMGETSTRIVRTIFDDSNAPWANLVLGEVITFPGKWSSYPPHHHPQPEIYHYRFLPEQGFGLTAIGGRAWLLKHRDTVLIHSGEVHPQVAAPGYAMYYIWVIRHLDGNRYGVPEFLPEHRWVMDSEAEIWPHKEGSSS